MPPKNGGVMGALRRSMASVKSRMSSGGSGGGDRYEFGDILSNGQTGTAVVYKGTDTATSRVVALKQYREDQSDFFKSEKGILRTLKKERRRQEESRSGSSDCFKYNIELLDSFGNNTLVLEFIPGHELEPWLQAQRNTAAPCLQQALLGLHALALANVVHLDIRSENIVVLPSGHVKIINFEYARKELRFTARYGTWENVPPEGLTLTHYYASHKSDIFALGVTFYKALEYRVPFQPSQLPADYNAYNSQGRDELQRRRWHKAVTERPQPTFGATPAEIQSVLQGMLIREDGRRPAAHGALNELGDALRNTGSNRGGLAEPPAYGTIAGPSSSA